MSYFSTKSKEYTVYLSYTEVITTSFKKIGLTQNSVQVAKLTMTVQYLQEKKKTTKQTTTLRWHRPTVPKANQTTEKGSEIKPQKKKKKASNIEFCSINKYKLKLNCEARKMTMLTVTKLVLALETKEEECWNLLINEKWSFQF